MAKFIYKYKDAGGTTLTDTIEADNIASARYTLNSNGKFIISIKPENTLNSLLSGSSSKLKKISKKDQSIMFKQLAFMQESGLQLHSSLSTLAKSTPNKAMKASLLQIEKGIRNEGKKLYTTLFEQEEIYGVVVPNQIKAGEETGEMVDSMNSISTTLAKEAKFNQKIKSAMAYPIMVTVVTIGIVYFLMTNVVPSMTKSIGSMGGEMPALTKAVMKVSDLVSKYGLMAIGITIAAMVAFGIIYKASKPIKYATDAFILKIPYVGTLVLKLKLVQFCRLYGTLTKSGVAVEPAFNIVKGAMGNAFISSKVDKVKDLIVEDGRKMDSAMAEVGIFPEILVQLVLVGDQSAKMPEVLEMMAEYFEDDVDTALSSVITYINTLLILVIGAVVGVVVVSMFLPMFGIIDTL